MKGILLLLALVLVLTSCKKDQSDPQPQTVYLQNDGYSAGATKSFTAGFVAGETAEVTLGPVSNIFQVTNVEFLFGGTGPNPVIRDIILRIYTQGAFETPGNLLYSSTYSITASDNTLQQIDVRNEQIIVNGGEGVRIAIEMTADGLPSVGIDQDGTILQLANWIKTGGYWVSSATLGLSGDFIIRATVEENI